MCTNFIPTAIDQLVIFGIERAPFDYKEETYPGYDAPIIRNIVRKNDQEPGGRECVPARFGLIPYWAKPEDISRLGKVAYNSRSETAGQKPMFKTAWKRCQFCLIPVECFYEPNWENGKAVRWRIELTDGRPFALAGLWEHWKRGDETIESFTMLTINADDHAMMRRFHRPGDEKRMPVILQPDDYDRWLKASTEEAFRMCQQYPAELMKCSPAPKVVKKAIIPPVADTDLLD
jgi:putative SOS response-associated peptidase YedK